MRGRTNTMNTSRSDTSHRSSTSPNLPKSSSVHDLLEHSVHKKLSSSLSPDYYVTAAAHAASAAAAQRRKSVRGQ